MKTKKTIRKMHHAPLARDIAKLQISIHSIQLRCSRLVIFANEIEQEGRTLRRENAELRGRLAVQGVIVQVLNPTPPPWPELPDGEYVIGSDPRD